jgi:hypothetical protein
MEHGLEEGVEALAALGRETKNASPGPALRQLRIKAIGWISLSIGFLGAARFDR